MTKFESKEERLARRHRERDEQMKASVGFKTFNVLFILAYPFIAVFTFVISSLLAVLSGLSKAGAWLASGGKSK
jgi:hypothetical protein